MALPAERHFMPRLRFFVKDSFILSYIFFVFNLIFSNLFHVTPRCVPDDPRVSLTTPVVFDAPRLSPMHPVCLRCPRVSPMHQRVSPMCPGVPRFRCTPGNPGASDPPGCHGCLQCHRVSPSGPGFLRCPRRHPR